jgi:hypothetical protein
MQPTACCTSKEYRRRVHARSSFYLLTKGTWTLRTFELAEEVTPLSSSSPTPATTPSQLMHQEPDSDILGFLQRLTLASWSLPTVGSACSFLTEENYHKNEQTLPFYVF